MDSLPHYLEAVRPVPQSSRVPWYLSTAQTYAGIMLWFVFWQTIAVGPGMPNKDHFPVFAGGFLSHGIILALAGVVVAALICHFAFYLVPGTLGLKSGLPLYIVGTSTYGVQGGFLMPGFLMGLLQFGWLGVSAYKSSQLLCEPFKLGAGSYWPAAVATVWAIAAAFVGLKGIRYVGRVATFAPIVPLVALVILASGTLGGLSKFDPQALVQAGMEKHAQPALSAATVFCMILGVIVGFFATAGAAGADFGMNNRHSKDVHLGGLVGIVLSTIIAGGLGMLVVAGGHGLGIAPDPANLCSTDMLSHIIGVKPAGVLLWLLALAAFPATCFATFIAANSFKTTLPKINPQVSVGLGTLASIILAVTGWAGNLTSVFTIIGASFGPICGAMAADYLLAGCKWSGPRAGFNPAGWISWAVGFAVGGAGLIPALKGVIPEIPAPPVAAFVVGFVAYALLAKAGAQTRTLKMPIIDQAG
ncbi:MAG: cytosine permease [Pirellulales bacterium]|nr:cytosine permease [Pirellulales bacterium]